MFRKTILFAYLCALAPIVRSDDDDTLMLSYERTSLDDCKKRIFKNIEKFHRIPTMSVREDQIPPVLGEFPHIAAIGWESSLEVRWLCGGSLIWENFILTAAHCAIDDNNIPPSMARMGDINLYSDNDDEFVQQLNIVDIIRHPKHKFSSTYYDIALMKLERKVTVNSFVTPVCLWLHDEIPFPELFAAGWGRTGFYQPLSETLLQGSLVPKSNHECSEYFPKGARKHRDGLMDHQFCAGDNVTDTCPGDSGGPLHVKLVKEARLIPFLVGVTSFGGLCGLGKPGVYVKVSKFTGWITDILQHHEEKGSPYEFEPTICADRYRQHRELMSESFENHFAVQLSIDNNIVFRWPDAIASVKRNCYGTLIEPNVVLTLAECVSNERLRPTHVVLGNGDYIEIMKFIIHPLYNPSVSSHYNNIAVLKLKSFAPLYQVCGWYGNTIPDYEEGMIIRGQSITPEELILGFYLAHTEVQVQVLVRLPKVCSLDSQYAELYPQGLQNEHLCFESKHTLVPGVSNVTKGGPILGNGYSYRHIFGISLIGHDFWLKKQAVGIRLSAHKAWLESILLPGIKSDSLAYIDYDLGPFDQCEYADGAKGYCIAEKSCQTIHIPPQSTQQLIFCANMTLVCCPQKESSTRATAIEVEFNECKERYQHLRTEHQDEKSHLVEIGWQIGENLTYGCFGYLISTRGIVSSASCLSERNNAPNIVRVGTVKMQVEKVYTHPDFNLANQWNNIAIVKLVSPMIPSRDTYPTCLWQNATHSPVGQILMDFVSKSYNPIHPMYKSDCEFLLNCTFDHPGTLCMNPGYTKYVTGLTGPLDEVVVHKYFIDDVWRCFSAGSPIVWRQHTEENVYVEYLVHTYNHGSCNPNTPRIVNRIADHIEWFKEVLQ